MNITRELGKLLSSTLITAGTYRRHIFLFFAPSPFLHHFFSCCILTTIITLLCLCFLLSLSLLFLFLFFTILIIRIFTLLTILNSRIFALFRLNLFVCSVLQLANSHFISLFIRKQLGLNKPTLHELLRKCNFGLLLAAPLLLVVAVFVITIFLRIFVNTGVLDKHFRRAILIYNSYPFLKMF